MTKMVNNLRSSYEKSSFKVLKIWTEEILRVLGRLWFNIALIAIGAFLIWYVPQARDILFGLSHDKDKWNAFFITLSSFTLWSFMAWYGSRLLGRTLFVNPPQPTNGKVLGVLVNWIPRIIGGLPLLTLALAIETCNVRGTWFFRLTILGLILFIVFVYGRRSLFNIDKDRINAPLTSITKDLNKGEKIYFYGLVIIALLSVFASITVQRLDIIRLAIFLEPLATIGFGLAILSWIVAITTLLDFRLRVPLNFILILWVVVLSTVNDNNQITSLETPKKDFKYFNQNKPPSIAEHFEKWIQKKAWSKDSIAPIFIVAGEGGGSRASFWTSGVLKTLQDQYPDFFDHVYASSTVSGSSAGFSFFNNLYAESKIDSIHKIAGGDYVSPANAAIFFAEIVQSILPFSNPEWDRSKYLEDAWSHYYTKHTLSHELDSSFLGFFNKHEYEVPVQFINSTVVERGQRAVISPLRLENKDSLIFQVYDYLPYEIPFKTAMSLSARFPILTSAGLLENPDICESPKFHLADGGFYENTGIETAVDIYNEIDKLRMNSSAYSSLQIHIIYIQNSSDSYYQEDGGVSILGAVSHPLSALYNTWATESVPMLVWTRDFFGGVVADTAKRNDYDRFLHFKLNHHEESFPLSRYISESTQARMIKELSNIPQTNDFKVLGKLLK